MPQDIIFIHSSDSEDGAKSDDSVILTSPPSTTAVYSSISKIVHGSAMEHNFIPPPPSLALRKDFIWATVSKCQLSLVFIPHLSQAAAVKRKQNPFGHQPSALKLAPVSASFAKAGGGKSEVALMQNYF